jgi:ACT domain-containing protein
VPVFILKEENMKAVLTIIGQDKVGIIARVSNVLAECNINILDINQTVMREYFTMIMLTDLTDVNVSFADVQNKLEAVEKDLGMNIRIQREDIFTKMHEV